MTIAKNTYLMRKNIFDGINNLSKDAEHFEKIFQSEKFKIERIISFGQVTPKGEWYNQEQDEYVMLIEGKAELEFEDKRRVKLTKGDYLLIPAHLKHKVTQTSKKPPCIWLAIYGYFIKEKVQ